MTAESKYKALIGSMGALLKPLGFSKRGNDFVLEAEGNLGIINFQKSLKSTAARKSFTVNLGVFSNRIARYLPPPGRAREPGIWDCHLRVRLGRLTADRDKWWDLDDRTQLESVEKEIGAGLLQLGVPEVRKYISDTALRDLWLTGTSASLTNVQRLMHLLILLRGLGPAEKVPDVLRELRAESEGRPVKPAVEALIERLG